MFERFTGPARAVVVRAQEEARALRHSYLGTEHLLLALVAPEAGIAATVLTGAGLTAASVRQQVERLADPPTTFFTAEEAAALETVGLDVDAVLNRIEQSFGPDALQPPAPAGRGFRRGRQRHWHAPLTPATKKALELSLREAIRLHHDYIGTEHLLLGLLRAGDSPAADIITAAGLRLDDLRRATLRALDQAA